MTPYNRLQHTRVIQQRLIKDGTLPEHVVNIISAAIDDVHNTPTQADELDSIGLHVDIDWNTPMQLRDERACSSLHTSISGRSAGKKAAVHRTPLLRHRMDRHLVKAMILLVALPDPLQSWIQMRNPLYAVTSQPPSGATQEVVERYYFGTINATRLYSTTLTQWNQLKQWMTQGLQTEPRVYCFFRLVVGAIMSSSSQSARFNWLMSDAGISLRAHVEYSYPNEVLTCRAQLRYLDTAATSAGFQ
jgi:hypothetical protein